MLRSLKIKQGLKLASFYLSRHNPSHLYACFTDGQVSLWSWRDGTRLQNWDLRHNILDSACSDAQSSANESDILFTIDQVHGAKKCTITAHQLQGMGGADASLQKTLYRTEQQLTKLWVSHNATCVVATGISRIALGFRQVQGISNAKDLSYKWWEFSALSEVVSMDAQQRDPQTGVQGKNAPIVDLVIGCRDGRIHHYLDTINKLSEVEKSKRLLEAPNSLLRWHRDSVKAVKWSRDGNYLISGGLETVLVLWQLDSGSSNFLPHLSSPIESIVVSPKGTSYAIRLADNSTMVISTQELQPTVNIPGIILPSPTLKGLDDGISSQATSWRRTMSRRPAVAVSKSQAPQILLAVPATVSRNRSSESSYSSSYLQTIDARSGTQLAKQALTRTKVTDRNIGPDRLVIDDPNVVLLQVSCDGRWLATVEEWSPPVKDLDHVGGENEQLAMNQANHLETSLRFWAWSEDKLLWELVTKVHRPYSSVKELEYSNGTVLDLVSDPSLASFVTLGDDYTLKVWKSKPRYRNNIPIKDIQGRSLMNWSCRKIIHLPPTSPMLEEITSRICISRDGSILAVGQSTLVDSTIYTVDLRSSRVLSVRADMFVGSVRDVSILDQYLVILADQVLVWNLVTDQLSWTLNLNKFFTTVPLSYAWHLAVDLASNSFAISLPETKDRRTPKSCVAIFHATSPRPLHVAEVRERVIALVSAHQIKGFMALDKAALLHAIVPSHRMHISEEVESKIQESADDEPALQGIDAIYGKRSIQDREEDGASQPLDDDIARGSKFIRQQHLSELFNYTQPFALPPVKTLFEQVAGLVAGIKVG